MSCPGYNFPLWRQEHGRVTAFIVFPFVNAAGMRLTIPYLDHGDTGAITLNFGKNE